MPKTSTTAIQIPAPNVQMMTVKIKGTNPLIFNKWSQKAIQMIQDKQAKRAKSTTKKEARDPKAEYEGSYYRDENGKIAFPALSIKQSLIGACRSLSSVPMTMIRGSVFVVGDSLGMIPVTYKSERMRTDMVKIGMGTSDIRYRGEVSDWSMQFIVKWNADVLSAEQVLNLIQIAGFSQGLGEWRVERNGENGTFELDMSDEKKE